MIAGAIGLVIVILFMILAYRIPGLVAGIALVFYTAAMLITLNAFDITLTLPGIAGIILGIGMVDKFTGGKDSKLDENDVKDILDSVEAE